MTYRSMSGLGGLGGRSIGSLGAPIYTHCLNWGGAHKGKPVYSVLERASSIYGNDPTDPHRVCYKSKSTNKPPVIQPPAVGLPKYQCYDNIRDLNNERVCFQAHHPDVGKPKVATVYTVPKMATPLSVPTVVTTYSPPKAPIYVAPPQPKYSDSYNPEILTEATPTAVAPPVARTTTVYTAKTAPIAVLPPPAVGPPVLAPSVPSADTATNISTTPAPEAEQQWLADNFMDPAQVSANQGGNKALIVGGLLVLAAIGGVVVWKGMKK